MPDKSKEQRRQDIINAIDKVVEMDSTENKAGLRKLLLLTAQMENSLGYDSSAYGRTYTNSFMSIDPVALTDILSPRKDADGNSLGYTEAQKETLDQLKSLGYQDPAQFITALKQDDPFASVLAARLYYKKDPNPLPDANNTREVFDYWTKAYNKGGVNKYMGNDVAYNKAKLVDKINLPQPVSYSQQNVDQANYIAANRGNFYQAIDEQKAQAVQSSPPTQVNTPVQRSAFTQRQPFTIRPTSSEPITAPYKSEVNGFEFPELNETPLEGAGPNLNYQESSNPNVHPNTKMEFGGLPHLQVANAAINMVESTEEGSNFFDTTGGSTLKGAGQGALAGAAFGGVGALVGGVIGGGIGLIKGITNKKRNEELKEEQFTNSQPTSNAAVYFNNYSQAKSMAMGGKLNNKSTRSFEGRTHKEGGIYIGNNVEVEDGEEMWNDFIFTNRF